jgi:hypothetical protein
MTADPGADADCDPSAKLGREDPVAGRRLSTVAVGIVVNRRRIGDQRVDRGIGTYDRAAAPLVFDQ